MTLFQRDGAPVDRSLLNALTSFLVTQGPDAREMWSSRNVGLGHALLRTSRSQANERQPLTLDGHSWIAADARLDRRAELRDQLKSVERQVGSAASDAELILHAYVAWKEDCLRRLQGDFSFAIWDSDAQRFFCARDHFGIKPFYYAKTRHFFVCSNTLGCVRQHPAVSDQLNDDAVADFLLFGLNCDNATTTFKSIERLPPAHFLAVTAEELRAQRYWSAPVNARIRYRRPEEYVEHFQENLRAAVADRLDTERASIFLSGGMDSGSIAATAREVAEQSALATDLRAYTLTCETLAPDREGFFAKQTADFLRIPISTLPVDDLQPFDPEDFPTPEPVANPLLGASQNLLAAAALHSRVALHGEGADNLIYCQMTPYVRDLMRRGEWRTLASSVAGFCWRKRSRWHRLGARMTRRFGSKRGQSLPRWIAPDFAARVKLRESGRSDCRAPASHSHPILPEAYDSLFLPSWTLLFESFSTGFTHQNVQVTFPFLDLRMVEYLLALPPYPLFLEKKLERDSMRGKLPESILNRAKTPLAHDVSAQSVQNRNVNWMEKLDWDGEIAQYVDKRALIAENKPDNDPGSACIYALCLNFWLQSAGRVRYNLLVEASHG